MVVRFALVVAGREASTGPGVTGWRQGEAFSTVELCLKARVKERGSSIIRRVERVREQIKSLFTACQYI